MQEAYLSIGDLAALSGVHKETIRYYERIGLVPPPARTPGGHRLYAQPAVKRLTFIRRGRQLGFGLEDIGRLLAIQDRKGSCGEATAIAKAQLANIREQIADLQRLEGILDRSVTDCRMTTVEECPILGLMTGASQIEEPAAA